jgi:di/tricarboxylate transporter
MDLDIALVLAILLVAVMLFVTERLRMDVVALLVLGSLALLGLVTPVQALSGFSSGAVVTVWAMFIISGGLSQTGVANVVGRQILRMAGQGELRLVVVIMLTAAVMSAFMNNVGVAAMLLPVVIGIARSTGRPPSRLLMPLAYGCLLGGLTTLIGTPPNILVSDIMGDYGLPPFRLFDFTPIGGAIMLTGVAFVALAGRFLLPDRDPVGEETAQRRRPQPQYDLGERLFVIQLPADNPLAGRTLAQSRLGSALRLNVLAVVRRGRPQLAPGPDLVLQGEDRLLVLGQAEHLEELGEWRQLVVEASSDLPLAKVLDERIGMWEGEIAGGSSLAGRTLYQAELRRRLGVNVLALRRDGRVQHSNLQDTVLREADILLLQGPREALAGVAELGGFHTLRAVSEQEMAEIYGLQQRFVTLRIPAESALAGKSLAQSRLGDAFNLNAMAIVRDGQTHLLPTPDELLQTGDLLLAKGATDSLPLLQALQDLSLEEQTLPALSELETETVGVAEIVLAPQTTVEGKTLRELSFREKYGLSVLAIWRQGQALRTNLRDTALRFGDAILVSGRREKLRLLGSEPDFLVLTERDQEPPRVEKAPLAVGILVVILLPVLLGWLPISIAAVVGATLMVLLRCLSMEEAYRFIEWPAVFLIAGMLPLGIAMEQTGAAIFLADGVITAVGNLGPRAVIAAIYILTSLATQIIPTAALVVLMAPIAMNTATDLGISPLALLMTVAMAASASFSSPVSHPANVLVMGPGGYRFVDYLKVGLPLTLVILVLVVILIPVLWPV